MNKIFSFYHQLLKMYSPQGWWPLLECEHLGKNPTKTGSMTGYHPNDFSYPKSERQRFEICIGAILTQNTNWINVEKALKNLSKLNAIDAKKILSIEINKLSQEIRPAGYHNQKAKKLNIFAAYYLGLDGRIPAREDLLSIWGIGPETADSILLYAYKQPEFVVDAYTRRILTGMNIIEEKSGYNEIKPLFEKNLPKDYKIYQEFHALIVEHAKSIRKIR